MGPRWTRSLAVTPCLGHRRRPREEALKAAADAPVDAVLDKPVTALGTQLKDDE